MGFHKHKDEIIDSLTSGDISNISEVSYHDSDAYFENLNCLQQDTGKNHSGDSSDDHNQSLTAFGGSYDNTPSDMAQKAPAKEQNTCR